MAEMEMGNTTEVLEGVVEETSKASSENSHEIGLGTAIGFGVGIAVAGAAAWEGVKWIGRKASKLFRKAKEKIDSKNSEKASEGKPVEVNPADSGKPAGDGEQTK